MDETPAAANLKTQRHNDITWVDVENPSRETFAELEREYRLHPVHLNESIQKVQHTQVEHEKNYLFLVLQIPVFGPHKSKIVINQVGIFLGKEFLITMRTGRSPGVADLFDGCQHDEEQRKLYFTHGSGYLLYSLIGQLLDDISAMTEKVVNELDEIEDLVFDNNGSDAQRIGQARQKIVRLRRVIGPKRLVLGDLAQQIDEFTGESMAKYYSNNTKMANKLWEVIEEAKETVEIYKDADFTTSTETTNEILAVLTIIYTFTKPITVVGTLYANNVPLPGGNQAGAWTFLGRYTTFEILVTASVLMALAMYLYFRNKKWF
jgi:magnesium transporter